MLPHTLSRPVAGVGFEGFERTPLEAQDFVVVVVVADLTERRLLDCEDCQD